VVRITRPVAKPGDPYQDPAGIVIVINEYMTVQVFVKEKKKVESFVHIFCAFLIYHAKPDTYIIERTQKRKFNSVPMPTAYGGDRI
jgi:hypothetical protein